MLLGVVSKDIVFVQIDLMNTESTSYLRLKNNKSWSNFNIQTG